MAKRGITEEQAKVGKVDPAQLARFLHELRGSLDLLAETAVDAYNKTE